MKGQSIITAVSASGLSDKARENWVKSHDWATDQVKKLGLNAEGYKIEVFGQIFGQGAELPLNKNRDNEPTALAFSAIGFERGAETTR